MFQHRVNCYEGAKCNIENDATDPVDFVIASIKGCPLYVKIRQIAALLSPEFKSSKIADIISSDNGNFECVLISLED